MKRKIVEKEVILGSWFGKLTDIYDFGIDIGPINILFRLAFGIQVVRYHQDIHMKPVLNIGLIFFQLSIDLPSRFRLDSKHHPRTRDTLAYGVYFYMGNIDINWGRWFSISIPTSLEWETKNTKWELSFRGVGPLHLNFTHAKDFDYVDKPVSDFTVVKEHTEDENNRFNPMLGENWSITYNRMDEWYQIPYHETSLTLPYVNIGLYRWDKVLNEEHEDDLAYPDGFTVGIDIDHCYVITPSFVYDVDFYVEDYDDGND